MQLELADVFRIFYCFANGIAYFTDEIVRLHDVSQLKADATIQDVFRAAAINSKLYMPMGYGKLHNLLK